MAQDVYVRLPTGLHSELRRRAAEQGVSLNQLCVALLAGGVGFKLEEEVGTVRLAKGHARSAKRRREEQVMAGVADYREDAERLAEALRLTQEYIGDELLPPMEGWSWFDALQAHAGVAEAESMIEEARARLYPGQYLTIEWHSPGGKQDGRVCTLTLCDAR